MDWWSAPAERVYLDWNATTPEAPEVLSAMTAAGWANPSSIHTDGRESAKHVLAARGAVAGMTGCPHVSLTSGGSEANALALRGRRVIASILEHASIHHFVTRWIRWDYADLEQALRESPGATVAVQAVNSETGCVQPVARVAALARQYGARVHCDAVQGWRSVPRGADTYALSAHKFRGPKGIGALAGVDGVPMRHGTLSPALCAGLVAAAARPVVDVGHLRDRLEAGLVAMGGLVNAPGPRVSHVTNVSFLGRKLVLPLDAEGISVSGGCACSGGTISKALTAIYGEARAESAVRCSLGETTTEDDIERALEAFARVLRA